jgi:hypothetical protein
MRETMMDKLADETARREVARLPWSVRLSGYGIELSEHEVTATAAEGRYARVFEHRADLRVRYTVPPEQMTYTGIAAEARQNALRQMSAFLYRGMLEKVHSALDAIYAGDVETATKALLSMRAEILQ